MINFIQQYQKLVDPNKNFAHWLVVQMGLEGAIISTLASKVTINRHGNGADLQEALNNVTEWRWNLTHINLGQFYCDTDKHS